MNINVIFTFEDKPQRFVNIVANVSVLKTKDRFFAMLVHDMSRKFKEKLTKISCSIQFLPEEDPIAADHWYWDCSGKYWDDEIPELLKDMFNIHIDYIPINQ